MFGRPSAVLEELASVLEDPRAVEVQDEFLLATSGLSMLN